MWSATGIAQSKISSEEKEKRKRKENQKEWFGFDWDEFLYQFSIQRCVFNFRFDMEQRAIWRSVRAAVRLYAVSNAIVLPLYQM